MDCLATGPAQAVAVTEHWESRNYDEIDRGCGLCAVPCRMRRRGSSTSVAPVVQLPNPSPPPPPQPQPQPQPEPEPITEEQEEISTSFYATMDDHNILTTKIADHEPDNILKGTRSRDINGNYYYAHLGNPSIASSSDVLKYLQQYSYEVEDGGLSVPLLAFEELPVIRLVEGYSQLELNTTIRAIDAINAWLPYDKHITLGDDVVEEQVGYDHFDNVITLFWKDIDVLNKGRVGPKIAGSASRLESNSLHEGENARVLNGHVNMANIVLHEGTPGFHYEGDSLAIYNRGHIDSRFSTVLHELMHVLFSHDSIEDRTAGYDSHNYEYWHLIHIPVALFPRSTMAYASSSAVSANELASIDGETLQAIYTKFPTQINHDELSTESLGPWDDYVIRYEGSFNQEIKTPVTRKLLITEEMLEEGILDTDEHRPLTAGFGVDWRNGIAKPWIVGGATYRSFTDSGLAGTATWKGDLVGFTPLQEAVHGDSSIEVDVARFAGSADFTGLEHWGEGEAPGNVGTGEQWMDGDLHYSVEIDNNYIRSNGGDTGYVSGRFVGDEHEGAVGIMEHPYLTAAFGAVRE